MLNVSLVAEEIRRRTLWFPTVPAPPHHHIQRVSRELLAVARGTHKSHEHLRNRLLGLVWITLVLVLILTPAMYLAEHKASGADIDSLWEAFLYSLSQLFTASSVTSPVTQTGKVLQFLSDLYAITIVATLAGSLGAFFLHRREEREAAEQAAATEARAAS
jgi:voltage-gated potassium channel